VTLKKLRRVLAMLDQMNGWIDSSAGGELRLTPVGQLHREDHSYLLSVGFVYVDEAYIYRPRTRK
jgi:hypothetical protein